MSTPLSIRFDPSILARLRKRANAIPGATPSGLAERFVDEGLRMADHPGVVFKDGPSGRRAALALGPDIWEVAKVVCELDERGDRAVKATAEIMNLSVDRVNVALRYYGAYSREIDDEIALADAESQSAEAAWQAGQRLLE